MSLKRKDNTIIVSSDTVAELIIDDINNKHNIKGITTEDELHYKSDSFKPFISKPDLLNTIDINISKFSHIDDVSFFKEGIKMEFNNLDYNIRNVKQYNVKFINKNGETEISNVIIEF